MSEARAFRAITVVLLVLVLVAGCGRKLDPRIQEGYDLVLAGKIDEAIALANTLITQDPRNAPAYNLLGLALYKSGNPEGSIEQYRRALEIDEDYAEAHFNLGNALSMLDRVQEAEVEFSAAVQAEKNFVLARYNLGKIYESTGRVDQALAQYRRCADLDDQFVFAFLDLGRLLDSAGDYEGALANYERAVELAPRRKEIRVALGNAYWKAGGEGSSERAAEQYQAAIGIDPQYVDGLYSMGVLLAAQERIEEALPWFERALEAAGDDTESGLVQKIQEYFREIGHEMPADTSTG